MALIYKVRAVGVTVILLGGMTGQCSLFKAGGLEATMLRSTLLDR